MNHKNYSAVAAIITLMAPFSVQANSSPFSGGYIGLSVGYTMGNVEAEYDFTPLALPIFSGDEDVNGLEFGGFAGYRHQFESGFVFGAEVGGLLSNADGERNGVFGAADRITLEKNNEVYVSLKPGYAFQENSMIYLIGGYHRTNFELSYSDGVNTTSADDNFRGFHFGVGAEYKPKENISLRLEYKNQQYNDKSYTTPGIGTEKYGGDENTFRIGVAYNF